MVSGDGRKLYAVNREMDERKLLEHGDGWMRKNVWPHLPLTDLPERSGEFGQYVKKTCRCMAVNGESGNKAEYACRCMNGKLERDPPEVRPRGRIGQLVSDFVTESNHAGVGRDRGQIQMWGGCWSYRKKKGTRRG